MGDRRILLGTGAVLVGMGTALVSGAAVAGADVGEADGSAQTGAGTAADSAASQPGRTSSRPASRLPASRLPASAATTSATAEQATSRLPRPVAADRQRSSATANNSAPPVAPLADEAGAVAGQAPPVAAVGGVTAAAQQAARVAVVTTVRGGVVGGPVVVDSVASVGPAPAAAAAAPSSTPVEAALLTAMSTLGWSPGGDPVAAAAAPAAAVAQRVGSRSAAVVGTAAAVAAAPPNPLPTIANGVTGVQIGHSQLAVPGALIGSTVNADWYFPTQADGTVSAQGVIWLQHGFGATNTFYSALAQQLAQNTNSIVVAPTLSSFPLTFSGGCLICSTTEQAAAAAFLDPNRTALVNSAVAAGYTGAASELQGKFALAGHSAGGGFATAVASDYVNTGSTAQDANLVGVVMYDGVSNDVIDGSFTTQIAALDAANKPVYQIAAPAQTWNLFGATTNALAAASPGRFVGVVLQDGSHVDSMLGVNPLFDFVLQLVTKPVPAGNTTANYTLSTGWINDMYSGTTPTTAGSAPQQGLYAAANQQIVMGSALAYGLPSVIANQTGPIDGLFAAAFKAVGGLFGLTLPPAVNSGDNGLNPATPVVTVGNGATGVRIGAATLDIPCGDNNFYAAPATWYFPTQADGTVAANGVIWLQHGFLGFDPWYSDMAEALAQQTNSIVVAPSIFWFDTPLCPGCYLGGDKIRQGASTMFSDGRVQLTNSARATGLFDGTLPDQFVLTGHSAGGNFATAVGALITQTDQVDNFLGVVMFDGVSRDPQLTDQLTLLNAAGKPDYQIAAPPQRWNAYGVANNILENFFVPKDQFYGLQIDNGSHTDVIGGTSLFANLASVFSSLIVKPSPPGGKEAVRTLATGWINDIYNGNTTYSPGAPANGLQYGTYGPSSSITPQAVPVADQPVVMGRAGATVMPAPPAVVVNPSLPPTQNYLGTWYEQGSVRQFFSIGLVNTKAIYSLNPDGSIKVQNSGNYFGPNGPSSDITGSAVPVTGSNNTRLNVGFFGSQPNADNPGNYWIIDRGTFSGNAIVGGNGYDWAIVSDPTGSSGFILTRPQTVTDAQYNALVARAQTLGVNGIILRTQQYPSASSAASRSVRV